jgi:oxygen-independent coproporphyrinogen-3 oxidase
LSILNSEFRISEFNVLGLYLHIPFCSAICNYCNFNRGLLDPSLKVRYVAALDREIRQAGEERGGPEADTVYFGGGTPSLLTPGEVERLIDACRSAFRLAADAEITLEANPESVSPPYLAALRAAGANRLSFGVQSFRDEELVRLSRLHSASRARNAVAEARAAGFDNISLDLMMWLPSQTPDQWMASVAAALAVEPEHLSMYMLEVYPNAPLRDAMARSAWSQAPDDDVAEMYVRALDAAQAAGYGQYEISNVARPGRRSRHNLKYWDDGEWLGFGCGAHSTWGGQRWKNLSSTNDYVERIGAGCAVSVDMQELSDGQRVGDALFTGLRLTDGVDVARINHRYHTDVWALHGRELERYVEAGLLRVQPHRWTLTRQGMLLAHEVMSVFV